MHRADKKIQKFWQAPKRLQNKPRLPHLEVIQDLSAEEGLQALRRMVALVALVAIPRVISSDNGFFQINVGNRSITVLHRKQN